MSKCTTVLKKCSYVFSYLSELVYSSEAVNVEKHQKTALEIEKGRKNILFKHLFDVFLVTD